MIKKAIVSSFILLAVFLLAAENSFAQGPCLLGVGVNCPQVNNPQNNVDAGGGTRYFKAAEAEEMLRYLKYGARYLVVLQRYQDPSSNCIAEDRAWVSQIVATNASTVAFKVGSSFKVLLCVGGNALTAPQVNHLEGQTQTARNSIYQWQKYQESLAPYLNDARYQKEYQRATAWVNWYTQFINNAQAQVKQFAP